MEGIGEEIEVLQVLADARGDGAIVEADGDEVYIVEGRAAGAIEGVAHFALEVAAFADGGGGEAGDEKIGGIDCAFDGAGPVLTGEEFAAVHPGIEAGVFEAGVELVDGGGIFFDVGEEDGGAVVGDELDAAGGGGLEEADALDFDAVALAEAAFDEAGDVAGAGEFGVG
ncbi:MAG: hypothetical protein IPP47_01100 [Bryobacterales bacterium]|nr:hypothetical protein [Bryobacterales bacterium]